MSDIQDDIEVDNREPSVNGITGTSKYLSGSNAITDVWGEGNFVVLKFTPNFEFAKMTVEMDPTAGSGPVELDEDMTALLKITDHNNQSIMVDAYDESDNLIKSARYPLYQLICEQAPVEKSIVFDNNATRASLDAPAYLGFTATGYTTDDYERATITVDAITATAEIDPVNERIVIIPDPLSFNEFQPFALEVEIDNDRYNYQGAWPTV